MAKPAHALALAGAVTLAPTALPASARREVELLRKRAADALRIFDRLVDPADSPDDRVVIIYGADHAYLLNRFAEGSGAFVRMGVADVLTE